MKCTICTTHLSVSAVYQGVQVDERCRRLVLKSCQQAALDGTKLSSTICQQLVETVISESTLSTQTLSSVNIQLALTSGSCNIQ